VSPIGNCQGNGEALHLVDAIVERSELVERYPDLFIRAPDSGTYRFTEKALTNPGTVHGRRDKELSELYRRVKRYGGKEGRIGC
jgi:hypothetical protein